ncbi:MAG: choice-of-anchor J domain-containing protein [Lentimicrobiaceae bacterium]|nr:choice-of-anchor J domain-containing protein [Lentimicrobiaceae bacterium]
MIFLLRLLPFVLAMIWMMPAWAQMSTGGLPPSFKEANMTKSSTVLQLNELPAATLVVPDRNTLFREDYDERMNGNSDLPPRVGKVLSVSYNMENSGQWVKLETGETVWQFSIAAPNAIALVLHYDQFYIPKGGKLFIYSANKKHVIGAFTEASNPANSSWFSTEMVAGGELQLEYVSNANMPQDDQANISIYGIGYIYNDLYVSISEDFYSEGTVRTPVHLGNSGYCNININCSPEGDNWQDQKRGIVATLQKNGSSEYICSGSIINNTAQDLTPYFLTAYHCSMGSGTTIASDEDLNQWVFYFNFERLGCENSSNVAAYTSLVGAQRLVSTGVTDASDGLLLKLNNNIPSEWGVYYNGWDRRNVGSPSGVGIHHPRGDAKKISIYDEPIYDATWSGGATNAHWKVHWAVTPKGRAATEGGSSGSPLFGNNGLIVGSLTGGNGGDYPCEVPLSTLLYCLYGKIWYHWDQSSNEAHWMKPYLDPTNSGVETLEGTYTGAEAAAGFWANQQTIWASEKITFRDASSMAESWEWTFEGGSPASFTGKTPPQVLYNTAGSYSVTLTINAGTETEKTVYKPDYIIVTLKQNECKEYVSIGTGTQMQSYPLGATTQQECSSAIYTAAEMGMPEGGYINAIAYYAGADALTRTRTVRIYLKEVDEETLTVDTWANEIAGLSELFVSSNSWATQTGWMELTLTTPFYYSGTKNLKVMVRTQATSASGYQNSSCYFTPKTNTHAIWSGTGTAAPTTTGTVDDNRPNIRFHITKMCGLSTLSAAFYNNPAILMLSENFDGTTFPPTGWSHKRLGPSTTRDWNRASTISFTSIDPTSLASAYINYDGSNIINNWLVTPNMTVPTEGQIIAEFYLSHQGGSLINEINLLVSKDNDVTWDKLWTTGNSTGITYTRAWRQITIDLSAYHGETIQLAWQYYGRNANAAALDNVKVFATSNKIEIFEGETVSFRDISTGPPVSWEWNLQGGDITSSTAQNVNNVFYRYAGTYGAALTVTNPSGTVTKTEPQSVIVFTRAPNVAFASSSDNSFTMTHNYGQFLPNKGGTVLYKDASVYYPTMWAWSLPGATPNSATASEISVEYPAGMEVTYDVVFTAGNAAGSATKNIQDYVKVGGSAEVWNLPDGDIGTTVYSEAYLLGTNYRTGSNTNYPAVAERFMCSVPTEITDLKIYTFKGTGTPNLSVAIYSDNNGTPGVKMSDDISLSGANVINNGYSTVVLPHPIGVEKGFFVVVSGFATPSMLGGSNLSWIGASKSKAVGTYSTSYALYSGVWVPMSVLYPVNGWISMNIVPTLTYTSTTFEAESAVKRKDVDNTTCEIAFTTTGSSWMATCDYWITLSETSGLIGANGTGSVSFTCENNTAMAVRNGKVTVYAGGFSHTVTVQQGGSYPSEIKTEYHDSEGVISLLWGEKPPAELFEDVERHPNFMINSPGEIGWKFIDGDGKKTWGVSGLSFPGAESPMAFMSFTPSLTTPSSAASYTTVSGNKFFACFTPSDDSQANDWIISPLLGIEEDFVISFWARALSANYSERFRVGYSTTGQEQSDFIIVSPGDYVLVSGTTWVQYTYTIPANARYVAINCVSVAAFALFIDDIYIGAPGKNASGRPIEEVLLRWDNGTNHTVVGDPDGSVNLQPAIRFEPSDLVELSEATIKAVDIYLNALGSNMELRIWEDGAIVYTQPLTNLTAGQFNRVMLTVPRVLSKEKELMVSYRFTQPAGTVTTVGVPGCDNGPAVAGKGDLIAEGDDNFISMSSVYGLNYNWNMAIVLDAEKEPIRYRIFRNGVQIAENITDNYYDDAAILPGTANCYQITATYLNDPFFESIKSPEEVCVEAKYLIQATAAPLVGGTIAGAGFYDTGEPVTLTATPHEFYNFVNWKEAGVVVGTELSYSFTVANNRTLVAGFELVKHTIQATAEESGVITPSGTVLVTHGESQTFTITPNTGYEISQVLVNGVNNTAAVASGVYTFTGVAANQTIVAQFTKKMYTVTCQTVTGALFIPVEGSSSPVEHGGSYKFMIELEEPYTQANVIVRVNGIVINPFSNGIYSLNNIVTNQIITLEGVVLNKYEIVAQAFTGGTITPAGVLNVTYGADKTFEIAPNTGYSIKDVVVNGESRGALTNYTFYDVKENGSILAHFSYEQGIDDNTALNFKLFSHKNVITILNEQLIPVKQVDIMDMYGRLLWTGVTLGEKTEISLDVAAGVYSVRILTTDDQQVTAKVVIH